MSMRSRSLTAASAAAAAFAVAATPAVAAAPPKGKYVCTYYTGSYNAFAGNLHILGARKYRVNDGKKGRYTRSGAKLRFKTGVYRTLYTGKFVQDGGQDIIYLTQKTNGNEGPICTRET